MPASQLKRRKLGTQYGGIHVRFGDKLDHESTGVAAKFYASVTRNASLLSMHAQHKGQFVPFEAYVVELLRATSWRRRRVYVASDAPERVRTQLLRFKCGADAPMTATSGSPAICDLDFVLSDQPRELSSLYHKEGFRGDPAALRPLGRYNWTVAALADLELLQGSAALLALQNSNWGRLLMSWSLAGGTPWGSSRAQDFVKPWFDDATWQAPGF